VARHRRPVNVRDDGLTAVLGPLVTVGGVERAVLLDVDSGMVLDAWACGEAPESSGSAETVPGGGAWPGIGSLWRSLGAVGRPYGAGGDAAEAGDVEAFGARHADLVRALLALRGSPPAELSLVVDDRHHLLRCVADPAGGRLALAVVVVGSPWVVRRVRRHLRQLPDAGLTTGPWLLTWAVGPPPTPWPPAEPGTDGLPPPPAPGLPAHTGSDEATADPSAVPDPRRGPAPPSALPPARSAGSR